LSWCVPSSIGFEHNLPRNRRGYNGLKDHFMSVPRWTYYPAKVWDSTIVEAAGLWTNTWKHLGE